MTDFPSKQFKSMSSLEIVTSSKIGELKKWVDAGKQKSKSPEIIFNSSIKLISQMSLSHHIKAQEDSLKLLALFFNKGNLLKEIIT